MTVAGSHRYRFAERVVLAAERVPHRSAAVAIGDGFDCGRLRMPRSDRADLAVAAITLVRVEVVEPRLASVPRCAKNHLAAGVLHVMAKG